MNCGIVRKKGFSSTTVDDDGECWNDRDVPVGNIFSPCDSRINDGRVRIGHDKGVFRWSAANCLALVSSYPMVCVSRHRHR